MKHNFHLNMREKRNKNIIQENIQLKLNNHN